MQIVCRMSIECTVLSLAINLLLQEKRGKGASMHAVLVLQMTSMNRILYPCFLQPHEVTANERTKHAVHIL